MSTLSAAPADPRRVAENPEQVNEQVSRPLVLITEQTVVFHTAVALTPRTKPARVIAALRALLLSSSEDARSPRRDYPPRRDAFLEEAAMAREMNRL